MELTDAYKSLNEALLHGGIHTRTKVNIHYIDSEQIEAHGTACLEAMDAILVPGGFGERGIEGKIAAVRHARERRIPCLLYTSTGWSCCCGKSPNITATFASITT